MEKKKSGKLVGLGIPLIVPYQKGLNGSVINYQGIETLVERYVDSNVDYFQVDSCNGLNVDDMLLVGQAVISTSQQIQLLLEFDLEKYSVREVENIFCDNIIANLKDNIFISIKLNKLSPALLNGLQGIMMMAQQSGLKMMISVGEIRCGNKLKNNFLERLLYSMKNDYICGLIFCGTDMMMLNLIVNTIRADMDHDNFSIIANDLAIMFQDGPMDFDSYISILANLELGPIATIWKHAQEMAPGLFFGATGNILRKYYYLVNDRPAIYSYVAMEHPDIYLAQKDDRSLEPDLFFK